MSMKTENDADPGVPVEPIVRLILHRLPNAFQIADFRLECCYPVEVLLDGPGGDVSSTYYVCGMLELTPDDARMAVSARYSGDWGFRVLHRVLL